MLRKHLVNAQRELRKAHATAKVHNNEIDAEVQLMGSGTGASETIQKIIMESEITIDSLQKTLKQLC
jgi:hypothetical protein